MLKVIYKTDGSPGPFEKRIYMKTNLPGRNIITVAIKVVVKAAASAKITVSPRKVYFDGIQKGEIFRRGFQVSNVGQIPLVINKIYSHRNDPVVLVNQPSGLTIAPDQTMPLELSFQAKGNGPFTAVFFFDTNAKNARNGQYAVMVIAREIKTAQ